MQLSEAIFIAYLLFCEVLSLREQCLNILKLSVSSPFIDVKVLKGQVMQHDIISFVILLVSSRS